MAAAIAAAELGREFGQQPASERFFIPCDEEARRTGPATWPHRVAFAGGRLLRCYAENRTPAPDFALHLIRAWSIRMLPAISETLPATSGESRSLNMPASPRVYRLRHTTDSRVRSPEILIGIRIPSRPGRFPASTPDDAAPHTRGTIRHRFPARNPCKKGN